MRSFSIMRRALSGPLRAGVARSGMPALGGVRRFSSPHDPAVEAKFKELDALRKTVGSDADETINLMSNIANFLRDTGKLDGAAELYEEAEKEVTKKYGEFHPHTYSSKANLGTIYGLMGKVDRGIPLLKEAVDGFKPLGGIYRLPRIQALSYLSILLHRSGQLQEAVPCYEDAIEERNLAVSSGDSPPGEGLDILGEYGVLQRELNNLDASVTTLETALQKCIEITGNELTDPTVAYLTFQLGVSYQSAGKFSEAEDIFRSLIEKKVIDIENLGFREVMNRYETVLIAQEKYDELRRVFTDVAASVQEKLGKSDKLSLYCLTVLAKAHHGLKDSTRCTELLKEGLSIMEENNADGVFSFDIAQLRSNIAAVFHEEKNFDDAESYYKATLNSFATIIEENLKDLPPPSVKVLWENTILAHRNYATFLEDTNRYSEASGLYSQLLDSLVANCATEEEIKLTIGCYNSLALKLHEERKSYAEAERALRVCLHHQTLVQGDKAADTLILRVNLGDNLRCQQKYLEAETQLHIAVPELRELLGKEDKATVYGMTVLAAVYRGLEKFSNAEPLLREIVEYLKSSLGETHPEVFIGMSNLGICMSRLYDNNEGLKLIRQAVKGLETNVGATNDATISTMCSLSACLLGHNGKDEAIEILEDALERVRSVHGENELYAYVEKQLNHALAV